MKETIMVETEKELRYCLWRLPDLLLMGAFQTESQRRRYLEDQKEMDEKNGKKILYKQDQQYV